jgi:hypothetical protein
LIHEGGKFRKSEEKIVLFNLLFQSLRHQRIVLKVFPGEKYFQVLFASLQLSSPPPKKLFVGTTILEGHLPHLDPPSPSYTYGTLIAMPVRCVIFRCGYCSDCWFPGILHLNLIIFSQTGKRSQLPIKTGKTERQHKPVAHAKSTLTIQRTPHSQKGQHQISTADLPTNMQSNFVINV